MDNLQPRKNLPKTLSLYTLSLLTLLVSCAFAPAQVQVEEHYIRQEYKPGKLETFLAATPNATLEKKEIGTFASPTTATFTAIAASDPATKTKLLGLEVRFQGPDQTITVYLDDDCITRLQKSVAQLEEDQLRHEVHLSDYSPAELAIPHVAAAYNDFTSEVRSDGLIERTAALDVGYFGYEGGFGLFLGPVWGKNHPSATLFYQSASLKDLNKILIAASAFLHPN